MRIAILAFVLPVLVFAACGDDDETVEPDAGAYFGGVRDTTIVLQDTRAEIHEAASDTEMTLAPRYRAEAEAFREYADAVEELEPPDLVQDDHENLVTSSRNIADGLDELADLVEEEPQSQEIITRQEEVQQDLANLAIEWNLACLGIDLPAADHDVPCNVVVAQ